jgi:hypothetical protein
MESELFFQTGDTPNKDKKCSLPLKDFFPKMKRQMIESHCCFQFHALAVWVKNCNFPSNITFLIAKYFPSNGCLSL